MDWSGNGTNEAPLTLEFVGKLEEDVAQHGGSSKEKGGGKKGPSRTKSSSGISMVNLQKIKADSKRRMVEGMDGNARIVVTLPRSVNTVRASNAVNKLLDELSPGEEGSNYFIETIVFSGVRFTTGGFASIVNFLTTQNVEQRVKKLVFTDLVGGEIKQEDDDNLFSLCQMFNKAPLESVHITRNVVAAYVWEGLGKQKNLKALHLNDVEMVDTSFQQLLKCFKSGDSLNTFHLRNLASTGKATREALDKMLSSCRHLQSFCYENRSKSRDEYLPVLGLAQMSKKMFKNDFLYMTQLELTGGTVTIPDNDEKGLTAALEGFHKLQQLKLSHMKLDSDKIKRIVAALRSVRPPLASIDLSNNEIDSEGASSISELSCLRAVTKNLHFLNLEHNRIDQKGALDVLESFAPKTSSCTIRLENNNFNTGAMFMDLARAKYTAESEVNDLRKDCARLRADKTDAQQNLRELLKAQSTMVNDMHELKEKAKRLEEDRQSLVKAFSVLGIVQHAEERDNLLSRIAKLEERVMGRALDGPRPANPSRLTHDQTFLRPPSPSENDSMARRPSLTRQASLSRLRPSISRQPSISMLDAVNSPHRGRDRDQPPISVPPDTPTERGKSPGRYNRSASARHLLVRAASERWKTLLKDDHNDQGLSASARPLPQRSSSSKSLAEFLNRSAPDGFGEDSRGSLVDSSVQTSPSPMKSQSMLGGIRRYMDDDSSVQTAHTAPVPSVVTREHKSNDQLGPSLGGARRRIRTGNSTSSRKMPARNESKSLGTPSVELRRMGESSGGSSESMPEYRSSRRNR